MARTPPSVPQVSSGINQLNGLGADWAHAGIVSAPLWDSKSSTFAGLLTTSDYINVIQYYFQNPAALDQIDQFRLDSLRGLW
jgi:hypothetical protein